MKCSAQWNYSVSIGTKEHAEAETKWEDIAQFVFEGIISLPALPQEGNEDLYAR